MVSRGSFDAYVPRLAAAWSGPPARESDGSLVSLDISGFTALSERLQARGRAGAEELAALISRVFEDLIRISDRYGGDVLKFRGDALLIYFCGKGHAVRAYVSTREMQELVDAAGETVSSVGPVRLRMSGGIYSGPCQFFLVEGTHRELVVAGPAATETLRLESDAEAGEILLSGPVPQGGPLPYELPPAAVADGLEQFVPLPLRAQLELEWGEAENRLVTAAFLKFSGVGEILAEEGLEGLHGQLNSLAALVDATCGELGVTRLGSDIDTDGGKLYLVAGAPATTGEDEERMLRVLRRVRDEYEGALVLRAGANRGNAFCGNMGGIARRTYSVMGDTVNLAARLTVRAEPGGILVTGEVLDRARTRYESRLQPLLVKGKERPITGYHVGAATGVKAERQAAQLPLVGRDAELAVFAGAVSDTRTREQRLVELVGGPGMGKSRLVEELRRQALGFTQLVARCDPYGSAVPYLAVRQLMRPLAGITLELDETAAGAQLVPWVNAVLPDLAPWLPLLAIPFGAQVPPTPETNQIDPSFRRERLHDAVEELLVRVLIMPTLFVVEDVHWGDHASLELLRHVVRQPAARPWLVCATRRPEGVSLAHGVRGHRSVHLDPLDDQASQRLALAAAGELALSTEALAGVRDHSGGNPLFVRELVGAARGSGAVGALPETVEMLITSRIDMLPPADRVLLRCASVLGTRLELDVLTEVLAGEIDDVGSLSRLERLGEFVAWEGAGQLRFVHDLYRTAAYETLSFRRRSELHGRVGDVLARRRAEPALLSLHFFEAGRYEQAWEYATTAGDQAMDQFANVVAAEVYDRAVASAEHLAVPAEEVARVCEALGDVTERFMAYDRASAAYARARALVGDTGRLLLKEGVLCERRGQYDQALDWYKRARLATEDTQTRARIESLQGGALFRQGRSDEAIEACEGAIEKAEMSGERATLAHTCLVMDAILTASGRFEAIWPERALALYEELSDPKGIGMALNCFGVHAYYLGRWTDALDSYRRSREAKERSGDAEGVVVAMNNEAEILCNQGRLEAAEALYEDALRMVRAAGHRMIEAFVTVRLGQLAAYAGRFDDAHKLLDAGTQHLVEIGARAMAVEADRCRVECLVLEGRGADASDLATATLARSGELDRLGTLGPSLERLLGYALYQSRRPDKGRPHLEESLRRAREANAEYEIALTLKALADTSGEVSTEAEKLFERLGVVKTPSVPLP